MTLPATERPTSAFRPAATDARPVDMPSPGLAARSPTPNAQRTP